MDNDELRVLRLLDSPRTKGELLEVTELDDERLRTILQMLKRNDLAQLTEGKRWQRTELGNRRLLEEEKEPEEEPKPPHEESITKRFEINQKKRALLRFSEELSSILSRWGWDDVLLKEAESLREDVEYLSQGLNEIKNMEGLEETEKILEELDSSWCELLSRDDRIFAVKSKQEREEKLDLIREFYTEFYPSLTEEELEKMVKRCREDPEQLKVACQHMESENHLESLLSHAFKHEINPSFIRKIHDMAATEKLELEYVVQLWEDYNLLASRYGPQDVYYFLKDRGRTILKKRETLWETFHRYMSPQRMPAPAY